MSTQTAPETGELRRELTAALQRVRELERANSELSQFAYMASHDLQEPVRKIMGFSDLLLARCADAQARDLAQRLGRAAERMSLLVDSLLAMARVTSSPAPLVCEPLDDLLDETLVDFEEALAAAGAALVRSPLPRARIDRLQIGQVMRNLIGNALKFRAPLRTLEMRVGTAPAAEGFAAFFIEDNGPGIDEADRERLFKPFNRPAASRRLAGCGLGLALCRRIAARHGGSVEYFPAAGGGCRFVVTLPTGARA